MECIKHSLEAIKKSFISQVFAAESEKTKTLWSFLEKTGENTLL
jgi:hypothetical protein